MSSNSADMDDMLREGERLKDLILSKPSKSHEEMLEIVGKIGCVV